VLETCGVIFTKSVRLRVVVGNRCSTVSEMAVRVPVFVGLNSPEFVVPTTSTTLSRAACAESLKSRASVCDSGTSMLSSVCGSMPIRRAVTEYGPPGSRF
jgi:hypothetical protein